MQSGKFQAFRRMNLFKKNTKTTKKQSKTGVGMMDDETMNDDDHDVDHKTGTSMISNVTHLIDTVIQKGSISTSSDDFNPYLFLIEVHHDTSTLKLELGLHTLQKAVNNRTDQMRQVSAREGKVGCVCRLIVMCT